MLVCGLSNGKHFAKEMLKSKLFGELKTVHSYFPDKEHYLRFLGVVKGKEIVFVQSMHPNPNDAIIELFLAAQNARELGAKKITGLIPYLGYMRQDKRFHTGEAFSARHVAKLLSDCLDEVITFDAHLHRIKKMSEIFSVPAKNLSASESIASFIEKKFKHGKTVVVGPDSESSQWAGVIAQKIGVESAILSKTRLSSRKVVVNLPRALDFSTKHVVIVDDIASTGKTITAAAKKIMEKKPASINCIVVHALLVENALEKMKKAGIKKIYTCNTIKHPTNMIDLSNEAIKQILGK